MIARDEERTAKGTREDEGRGGQGRGEGEGARRGACEYTALTTRDNYGSI